MKPFPADPRKLACGLAADLLACLRFYTRLPIPAFRFEQTPYTADITRHFGMLPLCGALIGGIATLTLVITWRLGLSPQIAAFLAIFSLTAATGAFHEDGFADLADSAGGATPDHRLAIMKDSRLGTFGTLALIASVLLRGFSIAAIARDNLALAGLLFIATGASSRTIGLLPLILLPPARQTGAGLSARTEAWPLRGAALLALVIAALPLFAGASLARILAALALSAAAAYAITLLARRQLGGQTGDVAGAAQQAAEIVTYLVFAAGL